MVVTNYLLSGMILQVVCCNRYHQLYGFIHPSWFSPDFWKKSQQVPNQSAGCITLTSSLSTRSTAGSPFLYLKRQLSDASPHPSHVMCWSPERIEFGGVFHQPIWRKRCASKKLETVSLGMKIKHIGKDHLGRLLVRGLCLSKAKMFVF